jgi:hypothetical protein
VLDDYVMSSAHVCGLRPFNVTYRQIPCPRSQAFAEMRGMCAVSVPMLACAGDHGIAVHRCVHTGARRISGRCVRGDTLRDSWHVLCRLLLGIDCPVVCCWLRRRYGLLLLCVRIVETAGTYHAPKRDDRCRRSCSARVDARLHCDVAPGRGRYTACSNPNESEAKPCAMASRNQRRQELKR